MVKRWAAVAVCFVLATPVAAVGAPSPVVEIVSRLLALSDARREAEMDDALRAFARHTSGAELLTALAAAAILAPWRGEELLAALHPLASDSLARRAAVIAAATGKDLRAYPREARARSLRLRRRALWVIRRLDARRSAAWIARRGAEDRALAAFLALTPPAESAAPIAAPRPHVPLLLKASPQ